MASYRRFSDESYKNWLKTTMSLQLLRAGLRRFVEDETETFHDSLRSRVGDARCHANCDVRGQPLKVPPVCEACRLWRDEILENHSNKNGRIYWNNCRPFKWSSEKWEVAKVYMPGGNRAHSRIDQFDISAILNLMTFCTHFQRFVKKLILTEVTNVRNQMMHSPEMKVKKEEMEQHLKKILELAERLQMHAPEMEKLKEEIAQLQNTELSIILEGLDRSGATPQREIIQNLLSVQKMQDLEQQVLKEKIEFLSRCLEEGKNTSIEVEGLRDFLDQNKDLLEELRPQVEQLNEIQQKVQQHDQQLSVLTEKVENLERINNEPVFSADATRYKNHLLELATKNQWPTPTFSEIPKAQGYTGKVEVNGQTFTGHLIHRNIKAAHQEVSKLALEQLSSSTQSLQITEACASVPPDKQSASPYFSSVTVFLNTDISSSEGDCGKEEATESAYKNLAVMLGTDELIPHSSYKLEIQQYFSKCGFRKPEEFFRTDANGKIFCVLKLLGPFTFQGQEGSTKKRHAEQQAAKVALLKLSGVLGQKAVSGDNYKGALKELLEGRGLKPPEYTDILTSEALVAEVGSSTSQNAGSSQNELAQNLPAEIPQELQSKATDQSSIRTDCQLHPVTQAVNTESAGSGQFYVAVKVPVKRVLQGPEAQTKEDAIRAAYTPLGEAFGLGNLTSASSASSIRGIVHDFFSKAQCQCAEDCGITTEGKFICKLDICGDFTFQNQEGTSRKQQAEQEAAKEALTQLATVLDCDLSDANGNYKGKLQELLAKQGEMPSYQTLDGPGVTEPSKKRKEYVCGTQIQRMLRISGFNPSSVKVEDLTSTEQFVFNVKIRLDDFTYQNQQGHGSKKDAIRNTYLKFGQALGICESSTAENECIATVKDYFKNKSFSLPCEETKQEKDKFFGLLSVRSFSYECEGKGPSEQTARQEASSQALYQLACFFNHETAVRMMSNKDAEHNLGLTLKEHNQSDPSFQHAATQYSITVKLCFSNFTLESKEQSKKSARNKLCAQILGLLGEGDNETSISASVRNQVDDWFKKRGLSPPLFDDTSEGAKVTFTVTLSFSHPGWESSVEAAEKKLVGEMMVRLRHLAEEAAV
ncbi:uncharacterized protein LOC108926454 isoform X2 [Scleropages formosus]|uniref:Uncharacterized LOC108926454 n=1 Tax=Scleropages formosus TaxID=113540 RepID=A0A8C9SFF9_SCLFO|nr:uncharacterized protein LOC108926454 isoform X2 [Scleropages formosus]